MLLSTKDGIRSFGRAPTAAAKFAKFVLLTPPPLSRKPFCRFSEKRKSKYIPEKFSYARVASALSNTKISSVELMELIPETETALAAAQMTAQAERERALDLLA
jgi:hypothetical protein